VRKSRRLASLDLGTNSTRLLIADTDGVSTRTVERRMVITRLGQGVESSRRLMPEARQRTLAVLEEYGGLLRGSGVLEVTAAATSALRDCDESSVFLDLAEGVIGTRPRILSGEQEARASFLGAVSDLDGRSPKSKPVLVFDIGGGSTELIAGELREARRLTLEAGAGELNVRSVDVGCVRMSERFLKSDPPSTVSIGRMESYIVQELKPAVADMLEPRPALAVGLAGTVTTLSGMKQGLDRYDAELIHRSRLSRAEVEELFRKLASAGVEERKRIMGLEPERADIIVGGAAVLRAVMDLTGFNEILVSEKDILDGLVLDLYRRGRQ
jgi:exopolyphosphatase/guanosine-5'-triphosphate,3'-diphosphate pyrophosphatase